MANQPLTRLWACKIQVEKPDQLWKLWQISLWRASGHVKFKWKSQIGFGNYGKSASDVTLGM
jgi:hypothetical protein